MPNTRQTNQLVTEVYKNQLGQKAFDDIEENKKGLVTVQVSVFQPDHINYKNQWRSKTLNLGLRTHLHPYPLPSPKSQILDYINNAFKQTVELSKKTTVSIFNIENLVYASVYFH